MDSINVIVEIGTKRAFASAADWPGWSRSGKDEESALQALINSGARYAQVIKPAGLKFQFPIDNLSFVVIEHLEGNATTDFGAPGVIAEADKAHLDRIAFERFVAVLKACWQALDYASQNASGRELYKGPRGGGRDLDKILDHVVGSEQGYLRSIAWKPRKGEGTGLEERLRLTREETVRALETAFKDGLPEQGPRGGKIWPLRYFIRRVSWHVLDHAWEIEDRTIP